MKLFKLVSVACLLLLATTAHAEKITIAAAADLKFAMDEIITSFKKSSPGHELEVIYGSSGKFHTQVQQGAPYDLFFSADIKYPQELAKKGMAASEVKPYAVGRIVIWSNSMDASKITLASLTDPKISRIAIANPRHAPYGKRAEEALKASVCGIRCSQSLCMAKTSLTPPSLCRPVMPRWGSLLWRWR